MTDIRRPFGVKIVEAISSSNQVKNDAYQYNDLAELKQLLLRISGILDNKDLIQTLGNNKEIRTALKELIIKSASVLA